MEKKMTLKKSKFTKLSKEKQRVLVGGNIGSVDQKIPGGIGGLP